MKKTGATIFAILLIALAVSNLSTSMRGAKAASTITVTNTSDSGGGSLRQAVLNASSGDTINFDSSLNGQTITLTSGTIFIGASITISGPGSSNLTVSGNNALEIFVIDSGQTVTISGLSLTGAKTTFSGGAIENQGGAVTVSDCNIYNNTVTGGSGGGVFSNAGSITITNCTISNNSATGTASAGGGVALFGVTATITGSTITGNTGENGGGGILTQFFDNGSTTIAGNLMVTDCTISNNKTSGLGGGIWVLGSTATVSNSTISGNSAIFGGGGVANENATAGSSTIVGTFTVLDSTISGNTGQVGGGINNPGGSLTLKNSTLTGNQSTNGGSGGAIENGVSATATITNCTIDGNTSTGGAGGGIDNSSSPAGTVTAENTIIAGNSALTGSDFNGTINSLGTNLVQNTSDVSGLVASDITGVSPMLGPLANNGGMTETQALPPCSPAIDTGNSGVLSDTVLQTDQRGLPRNSGSVDIGAYQFQGTVLTITPSSLDGGTRGTAYSQSLYVVATAVAGDPPPDTSPTFSVSSGSLPAGLTLSGNTISGTPTASGNFTFTIMATDSAGNSGCQTYTLNIASASITWVVNNTNDSGAGSLRDIVSLTQSGDTIEFAPGLNGQTITLTSGVITINDSITITGPGASELTVSGNNNGEIFSIGGSASVTVSGLSLTGGNGFNPGAFTIGGGAINNFGILSVVNCDIFGNTTSISGGGICNQPGGNLTVTNCTITRNSAPDNAGGGIASFTGTTMVISSNISNNSAGLSGGGIANDSNPDNPSTGPGTMTVIDSTISNNTGLVGGINNPNGGTLTMKNCTISGNQATQTTHGGGIENGVGSTATITNCTIFGNSTSGNGGGINNSGSTTGVVTLLNTIVAGNTAQSGGNDCDGKINSQGHNLIQNTTGVSGLLDTDQQGVNPMLGSLANNGGPTATLALLSGSPAIDGGDDSVLSDSVFTTDQRGTGFARKVFTHVDIGAFEQQVEISQATIPPAVEGSFYSQQFTASGNSPSFTLMLLGTVPPGLSFNSATGVLSGTPAPAGTYSFSIQAVGSDNPAKNVTNKYNLVVDCPIFSVDLSGSTICPGATGSVTVTVSGGTGPYQVMLTNNGGSQTGPSPLKFLVTPGVTTTYSVLSIRDSGGCSAQSPAGSATVTVDDPPVVTVNPLSQQVGPGSVTFTAAASGIPTPSVQWQVSTNNGATFSNITGATNTTLTVTATAGSSGYLYRAVFMNSCGTATSAAALLTVYDTCLRDDTTGDFIKWNSVTGTYVFEVCSGSSITLTGKGTVSLVDNNRILTGSTSGCKISADFNAAQLTGTATVTVISATGVSETYRINQTNPHAVCVCQ
jgi:hypothetical protein